MTLGHDYVELLDECKIFLGNLRRECRPEDVRRWLSDNGFELRIPCRMVIRGRSGRRRGLDALTPPEGAHSYPIKVAPSSKQLHNLLCFKLDVVILPVALATSIRFRTAQFIVLAHPRAHRGGRDRRLRRFHVPVRDPPPTGTPWAFSKGGWTLVGQQTSQFVWLVGGSDGRSGAHGGRRAARRDTVGVRTGSFGRVRRVGRGPRV